MTLSTQAQAFEARKNWIARLVSAKVNRITCNLGPATHPMDLPEGNRSYGWLRAHLDDAEVPGLPGMAMAMCEGMNAAPREPCSGRG